MTSLNSQAWLERPERADVVLLVQGKVPSPVPWGEVGCYHLASTVRVRVEEDWDERHAAALELFPTLFTAHVPLL